MAGVDIEHSVVSANSQSAGLPERRAVRVRRGGAVLVVAVVEFVVGMVIAQVGYGPGYTLSNDLISDLGVTGCGVVDGTGRYVCSPWWFAFDGTTVLFGILVILAMLWTTDAFSPSALGRVGRTLLILNGAGVLVAGAAPENVAYGLHSASAIVAFCAGAVGLIVVAIGMDRASLWKPDARLYTGLSGVVSLVAISLFLAGDDLVLGPGGMERLIVGPFLLWFVVIGLYLVRRTSDGCPEMGAKRLKVENGNQV